MDQIPLNQLRRVLLTWVVLAIISLSTQLSTDREPLILEGPAESAPSGLTATNYWLLIEGHCAATNPLFPGP